MVETINEMRDSQTEVYSPSLILQQGKGVIQYSPISSHQLPISFLSETSILLSPKLGARELWSEHWPDSLLSFQAAVTLEKKLEEQKEEMYETFERELSGIKESNIAAVQ